MRDRTPAWVFCCPEKKCLIKSIFQPIYSNVSINQSQWVNLTPHAVTVLDTDQNVLMVVKPSGYLARVASQYVDSGHVSGVPIFSVVYGELQLTGPNGPVTADQIKGTWIVSSMCLDAMKLQDPLLADHAYCPGRLVRNEQGQPCGCIGLVK